MEILLHQRFQKKLKCLPEHVRTALKQRLELLRREEHSPLLKLHPLRGNRKDQWSMNVTADWRLIYKKVDSETMLLLDIDTHSNLYG